jgi:surface polysaccharide O-acyltransferase-like enzyme
MIKPFSFRDLFKKDVKTICLYIGGLYAAFGALALLMVKMQNMMFSDFVTNTDDSFQNAINILHNIWTVYMPFLILIGICYLVFGLLYHKIQADKYQINLVLSIISLIWVIAYSISCLKYVDEFFKSVITEFEAFKYVVYIFAGFGFLAVFAAFTVPQYKISRRIKEQIELDKNVNTTKA